MQLGHLLTRSGLTYPEASSKVYHDSFCPLRSSVSLPWVIYFQAFYLRVVSSFSCIPVIYAVISVPNSWQYLAEFFVCNNEALNKSCTENQNINFKPNTFCQKICCHHHHHHHISVMQLGHLLTRSGLTYPEVSSKVYHDSFCQLDSSISLPWVIYFEAFYLHVVSSFLVYSDVCCLELLLVSSSYHHHHTSVMELGYLLTRSGLTYPEVSSKVCYDSFCQLGSSVPLPWGIRGSDA